MTSSNVQSQSSTSLFDKLPISKLDGVVLSVGGLLILIIGYMALTGIKPEVGLQVVFMRDGADYATNLWLANPANGDTERLTNDDGVFDFAVSPDGEQIAFTSRNFDTGTAEIILLNLESRQRTQVTNCAQEDSECSTPAWRPDGQTIAYQRVTLNTGMNLPVSPNRIWLLDLSSNPIETFPLIPDPQVLGYSPVWSDDGSRLAFYDSATGGILIYNFSATDDNNIPQLAFLPTTYGTVGDFSPDGVRMVFPEMLLGGAIVHSTLRIANLNSLQFQSVTSPDEQADDPAGSWHPDGSQIAFSRRYLDEERRTIGHQIYILDVETGETAPLIFDARYTHARPYWSPDGTQLLVQRFPQLDADGELNASGTIETWLYDMASGELSLLVENAYNARWVPE